MDAIDTVEGPHQDQVLHHRSADQRPIPEIGQRLVGGAGLDPHDVVLGNPFDIGQREPYAPPRAVRQTGGDFGGYVVGHWHGLYPIGAGGGVYVHPQHGDVHPPGLLHQQPLGIHARVVGEYPGQEMRRIMPLQPRRLISGQGKGGSMRLTEAEGRERLQHLPDAVGGAGVVSALPSQRNEPLLGLGLALQIAKGTPSLIRLRVAAAGDRRDDLDDLLMEDHHPVGLGQHLPQTGVQITRGRPALPGVQEGHHHVGLHRPGTEQRDVDDEVLERGRPELAHQFALTRGLDLKAAQRLGVIDHVVGLGIIERRQGIDVGDGLLAAAASDLLQAVGHRRLHAYPEDVQLEQAHVLDVVLVELAHREAAEAGLQRRAVAQRPIRQDDSAGVQGQMPGQTIQRLHQVEQHVWVVSVERARIKPGGPQLGQIPQRGPGVPGPDVREGLRHGIDLGRRQAQRRPHVPDGMAHPVGVDHRDAGHPFPAESGQHLLVDLGAPGRLHVDVDVRQRLTQRRHEALHDQPVRQRIDTADAQQIVDQAAGPRAAGGAAHPHGANQGDHVGHRQEIGRKTQLVDGGQLLIQPNADLRRERPVAGRHARRTAGAQHPHGLRRAGTQSFELR